MDERFLESWLNRSHCVLGLPLQPFSLWHCAVLDLAGSPALDGSGELAFDDLYIAARICNQRPFTKIDLIKNFLGLPVQVDLRVPDLKRSGWTYRRAQWFSTRNHKQTQIDFQNYVKDFAAGPRMWETQNSRKLKTPWPLAMVARLRHLGHFSGVEAWSMPVGQAFWWSAALVEATGVDPKIISQADYEALKEAGHHVG